MSDTPLTDASEHAHVGVKLDGHGKPTADADVGLGLGRGWTLDLHAQYGKAVTDRWAALDLTWRPKTP